MIDIPAAIEASIILKRMKEDLVGLRLALSDVKVSHPAYAPGSEPTFADVLKQLLDQSAEVIEYDLTQISTYLNEGQDSGT